MATSDLFSLCYFLRLLSSVNRKMSSLDEQATILYQLWVQEDLHAIVLVSEQQCNQDFFNTLNLTNNQATVELKSELSLLMFELRQRIRNRIAAIKRRLDEAGIIFPPQ